MKRHIIALTGNPASIDRRVETLVELIETSFERTVNLNVEHVWCFNADWIYRRMAASVLQAEIRPFTSHDASKSPMFFKLAYRMSLMELAESIAISMPELFTGFINDLQRGAPIQSMRLRSGVVLLSDPLGLTEKMFDDHSSTLDADLSIDIIPVVDDKSLITEVERSIRSAM